MKTHGGHGLLKDDKQPGRTQRPHEFRYYLKGRTAALPPF